MNDLFQKASKARNASRFNEAEKIYAYLVRQEKDGNTKGEAYLGLADVERIQGRFERSLDHYEKAIQIFKSHDLTLSLDARVGWALAARAMGRPFEALKVLKKCSSAYAKEKDLQGAAFTHWALGGTYRIAGNMPLGLIHLKKAASLFNHLTDEEGLSYVCCALGGIYRMLGRYSDSGRYYREANRRMKKRKDTFGMAYSYCGLGNVQRMAGHFEKALIFYRRAEKLYRTIGDRVSYAYTLWSLGTAHKMLGQSSLARSYFQKADGLFEKTGDTRGRIYTLLGFAEIEWLEGRQSLGSAYWQKARSIAKAGRFVWEGLHVRALREGRIQNLRNRYYQTGSLFYPKQIPVNWP